MIIAFLEQGKKIMDCTNGSNILKDVTNNVNCKVSKTVHFYIMLKYYTLGNQWCRKNPSWRETKYNCTNTSNRMPRNLQHTFYNSDQQSCCEMSLSRRQDMPHNNKVQCVWTHGYLWIKNWDKTMWRSTLCKDALFFYLLG